MSIVEETNRVIIHIVIHPNLQELKAKYFPTLTKEYEFGYSQEKNKINRKYNQFIPKNITSLEIYSIYQFCMFI